MRRACTAPGKRSANRRSGGRTFALLALFGLLAGEGAFAQSWPAARPIRFVVPYLAGGTPDFFARALTQRLTEQIGQQFVVDNRPGAGGNIGTEQIARAAPDGYTIGIAAISPFAINIALYGKKMPFDPNRDFELVGLIARSPLVLISHPSVPVRTLREVVALARSRPGQLSYGSAGNGTSNHLVGEMFKAAAGLNILHVPFRGTAQSILALIGGELEFIIGQVPSTLAQVKAGKVRALAVSSARRNPAMPDVPTFIEGGLAGFEASSWYGVAAPLNTPRDIVTRLNAEIVKALATQELKARYLQEGATTEGGSPADFAAFIRAEQPKWANAVKLSGAKLD